MRVLVAGAGGHIGGHLVKALLDRGDEVLAVDIKPVPDWWQSHRGARSIGVMDLREIQVCDFCCGGIDTIYNLACDMGGIGFIAKHKAECMLSVLINTNLLRAAVASGVRRYFYASSSCVYPDHGETEVAFAETDAYPAAPFDGYGWEKLFSERMCRHFHEDYGLTVRIARFFNVYGTHGDWRGGREKVIPAICRKVAEAKIFGRREIEIWGDGEQTRSFTYMDDCIDGILRIMACDAGMDVPINLGSSRLTSIGDLAWKIARVANGGSDYGDLTFVYRHDMPEGVRGRSSDNALARERLKWEPSIPLEVGIEATYRWVYDQVVAAA
jgi:nucleoside-diphosphate-sugar epimerase